MRHQPTQSARRDIGDNIVHWTKRRMVDQGGIEKKMSAIDVLEKILEEEAILGSSNFIKGKHECVCFTEAPIVDMISTFKMNSLLGDEEAPLRYEAYGIAVKKIDAYKRGARPVIYQRDDEYESLPESHRWRHCTYNPAGIPDFAWEREWRIQSNRFELDPESTTVLVTCDLAARKISAKFGVKWQIIPLDFLGLEIDPVEYAGLLF